MEASGAKLKIELTSDRLILRQKVYTGETVFLVLFLLSAVAGFYYLMMKFDQLPPAYIALIPLGFGYFAIGLREDVEFEFDRTLQQVRWRRFRYFIPSSGVLGFSEIQTLHQVKSRILSFRGIREFEWHYVELLTSPTTGVTVLQLGMDPETSQSVVQAVSSILPRTAIQIDKTRVLRSIRSFF